MSYVSGEHYVRAYRPGAANRECHFSNVGKGDQQPSRYQNSKISKAQKCFNEKVGIEMNPHDHSMRLNAARARLQEKWAKSKDKELVYANEQAAHKQSLDAASFAPPMPLLPEYGNAVPLQNPSNVVSQRQVQLNVNIGLGFGLGLSVLQLIVGSNQLR